MSKRVRFSKLSSLGAVFLLSGSLASADPASIDVRFSTGGAGMTDGTFIVQVANQGSAAVRDISVSVDPSSMGLALSSPQLQIGDLDSNQIKQASAGFSSVEVLGDDLTLMLSYQDDAGNRMQVPVTAVSMD